MKRRGFTLVEIMIVVAIIALLAAIAIPNLLRARVTANQAAAQASLRTLTTALESLRSTTGSYESAAGTDVTLNFLATANPPYIDAVLGCAAPPCAKQGYNISQITVGADNQTYVVTAVPVTANVTGVASYCVTDDGVVRIQPAGGAIASRAACQALNPAQ